MKARSAKTKRKQHASKPCRHAKKLETINRTKQTANPEIERHEKPQTNTNKPNVKSETKKKKTSPKLTGSS